MWCCFSIYTKIRPSSFLLSCSSGSYASTWNDSTGDVLKAPVYILIPSLCMLTSFLVSLGKLYCTVGSCIVFRFFGPLTFCLLPLWGYFITFSLQYVVNLCVFPVRSNFFLKLPTSGYECPLCLCILVFLCHFFKQVYARQLIFSVCINVQLV